MSKATIKYMVSWQSVFEGLEALDYSGNVVYGVPTGGMVAAGFLKKAKSTHNIEEANVILDDILDSGKTKEHYLKKYPDKDFIVLINKNLQCPGQWVVFPWEADHPFGSEAGDIHQNVIRLLQYIGEDVERDGLKDTPSRVIKSYSELYIGYQQKPKEVFTFFEEKKYDEIVLLKDIEMYSMCEHHMLPFHGKAHIAYIPNGKVVGISKLARLLDVFARRLQIQERICRQVTDALDEYLEPQASACIIDCQHMCMTCRGVEKQHSVMTTSSMTGKFRTDSDARRELLSLIKGA